MMSVRALFVVGRNRGVADRDDKRARKARTAVVRGGGRAAFDVHVVTAVTAIPLKSVLLVVLNGEIRAILQVGLIVVAEIDGMNVASAGAIHGKRSVIERERGILACAHRHPIPLGGIRDGTNAGHACIDILKHERMSLKGDTFVGKLQDMVVVIDSEVIIKVKTSGFGIDKELKAYRTKSVSGPIIHSFRNGYLVLWWSSSHTRPSPHFSGREASSALMPYRSLSRSTSASVGISRSVSAIVFGHSTCR